jgi:hypothetical protein
VSQSNVYWNLAEAVKDELESIHASAIDMYSNLEANDDAGEVADFLADIQKAMTTLEAQIGPAIPALRAVVKALDAVPVVKA